MSLLTPNLTLEEMTRTSTGLNNNPRDILLDNVRKTAQFMEKVRALLGQPISVTSGYRSPAVNMAVGGSKTSDHMYGLACDFVCPKFGEPSAIVAAIAKSDLQFDQLFDEGKKTPESTGWVHVGIGPRMRREVKIVRFANGDPVYEPWRAA